MEEYAARLGADCAFFIQNKPVFATGIGNIFEPIVLSLKGYYLVLVKPNIFVSTKDAFSKIKPKYPEISIKDILLQSFPLSCSSRCSDEHRLLHIFQAVRCFRS